MVVDHEEVDQSQMVQYIYHKKPILKDIGSFYCFNTVIKTIKNVVDIYNVN